MKTQIIGAFDAKTHLSELLAKVSRGQAFVITRRGQPVAELRPILPKKQGLGGLLGMYEGQIKILPGFDDPLDEFKEYL